MIVTIEDFVNEHSKYAIPVPLASEMLAVIQKVKYNGREPTICLITGRGELPDTMIDMTIADGGALDADDEGWDIVMREASDNLRKMADAIDAWREGKQPVEFCKEFGLYARDEDEDDEDEDDEDE